ncbi:MAG TPA: glycosyltransferase family 4 protein [Steroidobacteraceae bacterium]|nr:glycosyltransferase family 4 protein [Steroidobacteraceae bacterium]
MPANDTPPAQGLIPVDNSEACIDQLASGESSVASRELPSRQFMARVLTLTAYGDDYTTCFNAALKRRGIEVEPAQWSGRWLHRHTRRRDIIGIHWPSFLYYHPESRRKTWLDLLRFVLFLGLLRARGVRIVWTAHNLYPHEGGRATLAHRVARRFVVAVASHVCVHGQGAAERVMREFGVKQADLVFLEHGHWIDFYPNVIGRAAARERLKIAPRAYMFLFIGACRPYKNLEYLVRSHAAMQDDSLLWIVGRFQSAAYRQRIVQAQAEAGGGTTVVDGFVPPEDVQVYLNACDAVVLPYKEILTSGAVMLAISFGRPVVAPRMGTLEEVICEECGILYDPQASAGLTDALRAARRRAFDPTKILARAASFSWDRSAQAFTEAVLDRGRSAPPG